MNSTAHLDEVVHGRVMEFDLHGKLSREDYEKFVPETERMLREYGALRILVRMQDFHGWDPGAFWADMKWNAKHFNHIERLAIVGERTWHQWMTSFCKPFTTAKVRYFTLDQIEEARRWLNEFEEGEMAPPRSGGIRSWERNSGSSL